jgi:phosphopantetheine--protein transferase-like protein
MILRETLLDGAVMLLGRAGGSLDALHPDERALLSPRATDKRRDELVGGRLLAKEALRRAFGAGDWIIDRARGEHEGAPIVRGPHAAHVSISHTDGLVLAIAARTQVALDLVKLEPLPESLCEQTFTANERRAWQRTGEEHAFAVAFAAKEAALKWLRVGMGAPLHEVEVLPRRRAAIDVCVRGEHRTLACATFTHEHWLGFVLLERSEHDL